MPIAAIATAEPKQSEITAYRALAAQDLRLATIGYRIAYTNRSFCKEQERNPGMVIHDIAQYPDADSARAAFGFSQPLSVLAVVPGGPADKAGIMANDGLISWLGEKFRWNEMLVTEKSYQRMAAVKIIMQKGLSSHTDIPLQFKRNGQTIETTIVPELVCASDFQIDTSGGKNAGADGHMISITVGLLLHTADDDELAAIVAHEFAHNMLKHRAYLDGLNVKRGLGRMFGKSKKAILQTETEADQLSVWLMSNAGYDPGAAIRFGESCRSKGCSGSMNDGTHLKWSNRIKLMKQQIDLIRQSPRNDGLVTPPLLLKQETQH